MLAHPRGVEAHRLRQPDELDGLAVLLRERTIRPGGDLPREQPDADAHRHPCDAITRPLRPTLTDRVPVRSVNAVKMRAILSLVLVPALAAGAGCGGRASGEGDPDRIDVVASFYPLAEAAARTGGPAVEVTDLTPPGTEPHDLELGPDDLEAIASADLVVYLGGGFQPSIEDAVEGRHRAARSTSSTASTCCPTPRARSRPTPTCGSTRRSTRRSSVGWAPRSPTPHRADRGRDRAADRADVFLAELEDLDRLVP